MRVVIIGGNAAGMSAAAKLKRMNPKTEVIVYEIKKYISFGACALPYYIGDFFEEDSAMIVRTKEQAEQAGIQVKLNHEVTKVEQKNQTVEVKNLEMGVKETVSYDRLLIAAGASAILPPIENVRCGNVFTLRTIEDGIAIRKKMLDSSMQNVVIIGAGFIGLELVDAAMNQGKNVHLFQSGTSILKGVFDKEITDILEQELIEKGVHLHFKAVQKIIGEDRVTQVVADGETFAADLVLISVGIRPNTAFLEGTEIERIRNGAIVIDKEGRTNLPNIYAAGDCAVVEHRLKKEPAYIPLATTANKVGRVVGENLAGGHKAFPGTLGASCLKLLSFEAGKVGLSEEEAAANGYDANAIFVSDKTHTDYYPGQEAIYVKLVYEKGTKKILGGQIVGKDDAVMRTNVLSIAIAAGMTTEELGFMDFCYAPPFAKTWDVLNVAGNAAK